jgi:hypothetical protein
VSGAVWLDLWPRGEGPAEVVLLAAMKYASLISLAGTAADDGLGDDGWLRASRAEGEFMLVLADLLDLFASGVGPEDVVRGGDA